MSTFCDVIRTYHMVLLLHTQRPIRDPSFGEIHFPNTNYDTLCTTLDENCWKCEDRLLKLNFEIMIGSLRPLLRQLLNIMLKFTFRRGSSLFDPRSYFLRTHFILWESFGKSDLLMSSQKQIHNVIAPNPYCGVRSGFPLRSSLKFVHFSWGWNGLKDMGPDIQYMNKPKDKRNRGPTTLFYFLS